MNSDLINIQDQVFQGPKDKIYLIHREGKEQRQKRAPPQTGNPVEFLEWEMTSNLTTIIVKIRKNCPNLVELLDISTYAKIAGLTTTRPHAVIKVPLSELVNIGSILYALVFHPDWLIRSNFRLRRRSKIIPKTRGYKSSPFTRVHKRVTN